MILSVEAWDHIAVPPASLKGWVAPPLSVYIKAFCRPFHHQCSLYQATDRSTLTVLDTDVRELRRSGDLRWFSAPRISRRLAFHQAYHRQRQISQLQQTLLTDLPRRSLRGRGRPNGPTREGKHLFPTRAILHMMLPIIKSSILNLPASQSTFCEYGQRSVKVMMLYCL
ncbi:hypothetical protein BDZ45DRAFT_132826 [Acephala macrosclerotiorum]|nr:hypothetical protein BDZ45DRAFT_132826 [Acephala macrosclerotiorum]